MSSLFDLRPKKVKEKYVLKNMHRYNNTNRLTDESVAEHSFFVALFSLEIATALGLPRNIILDTVAVALLHDVAEIEISDIPHNVKERSQELKNVLAQMESNFYKANYPEFSSLMDAFNDSEAKGANELISAIVELADILSVLQYASNEIQLGNKSEVINGIFVSASNRASIVEDTISKIIIRGDVSMYAEE